MSRPQTWRGVERVSGRGAQSDLRTEWEKNANDFVAWARTPMHDSYWRFHRDQFLQLVPAPGRLTLDLGCGEGRFCRDLQALGHTVVGIDSSPTMIAHARQAEPSIDYHVAGATRLPLKDESIDLALAFMSLQDIDDMPGAVTEIARVLEPAGRFCLAIVHPLNSAGAFQGDDPDSPYVIAGSYLTSFRYEESLERDGLAVTFASEHRPLEDYFGALTAAGLLVEQLREPAVPEHAIRSAQDRRWQRLPCFLHVSAIRR